MGMSEFYGPRDDEVSRRTLAEALDLGATFFNTADTYGSHHNEHLIGSFLKGVASKPTIATKFGIVREPHEYSRSIENSPGYIRRSCEGSLRRLGVERIDLYYVHRVDPQRLIEETMMTLSDLVAEGKIAYIGLCEVSAETLKRGYAIHPVAAVQSEYSLWTLDVEAQVLPLCRRLGVGFVPCSPLGRGFLTGRYRQRSHFAADDVRASMPRFEAEALARNLAVVDAVSALSMQVGCTPAQLCLAWLLAPGEHIVPIPGTKHIRYLRENIGASEIRLTPSELSQLRQVMTEATVAGDRYTSEGMKGVNA